MWEILIMLLITRLQYTVEYNDGLVQDCSISSALAMEILQSCNKPSISWSMMTYYIERHIDQHRIQMRLWTHKTQPISHPHGWARVWFWRKSLGYKEISLYFEVNPAPHLPVTPAPLGLRTDPIMDQVVDTFAVTPCCEFCQLEIQRHISSLLLIVFK